jgi:hypothetical protein
VHLTVKLKEVPFKVRDRSSSISTLKMEQCTNSHFLLLLLLLHSLIDHTQQEGEKQLGKFVRGVNSEQRKVWEEKRDRVAKEMGVPRLVVTTKQVELWDLYKEKILNKKPATATDPAAADATNAADKELSA